MQGKLTGRKKMTYWEGNYNSTRSAVLDLRAVTLECTFTEYELVQRALLSLKASLLIVEATSDKVPAYTRASSTLLDAMIEAAQIENIEKAAGYNEILG